MIHSVCVYLTPIQGIYIYTSSDSIQVQLRGLVDRYHFSYQNITGSIPTDIKKQKTKNCRRVHLQQVNKSVPAAFILDWKPTSNPRLYPMKKTLNN